MSPHPAMDSPGSRPERSRAPEPFRGFAEGFFQGAGPALAPVLGGSVAARLLEVESLGADGLVPRVPPPWVVVPVAIAGVAGSGWLVLSVTDVHALLATGAPATVGDLSPAEEGALRDAVSRWLAEAQGPLGALLGRPPVFGAVEYHRIPGPEHLPGGLTEPGAALALAELSGPHGLRARVALVADAVLAQAVAAALDQPSEPAPEQPGDLGVRLDLILDITVPVTVELGRTRMPLQDVLRLAPGSVIELDKAAGDPVDLLIHDRLIARGEVVVIEESFGVRLTSIVTPADRVRSLR